MQKCLQMLKYLKNEKKSYLCFFASEKKSLKNPSFSVRKNPLKNKSNHFLDPFKKRRKFTKSAVSLGNLQNNCQIFQKMVRRFEKSQKSGMVEG